MKWLIALFLSIPLNVNAQLFAPYDKEVESLIEYAKQDYNNFDWQAYQTEFNSDRIGKPKNTFNIRGYLGTQKLLTVYLSFYKSLHSSGVYINSKGYSAEIFDIFKIEDPRARVDKIIAEKWLIDPTYVVRKKKIMGYLPGHKDVLVSLFEGNDNYFKMSITFNNRDAKSSYYRSKKESVIKVLSKYEKRKLARKKVLYALQKQHSSSICNNRQIEPIDYFESFNIEANGKCLFNCEKTNKVQFWHFGNAIYNGLVANGKPHTEKNGKFYNGVFYFFDDKYCESDPTQLKEYKKWIGKFKDGVPFGIFKFSQKVVNNEGTDYYAGRIKYEDGKVASVMNFNLDMDWQPTTQNKSSFRYTGNIENGKIQDNFAKIYDKQKERFYFTKVENGKPTYKNVKVVNAVRVGDSKVKYKMPKDQSNKYYYGEMDEKWNIKGRGTLYVESDMYAKGKGKLSQWAITATWRDANTVDYSQPVQMRDLITDTYWSGKADQISFIDGNIIISGYFKVSKNPFFKNYTIGRFKNGRVPGGGIGISFPMPDGNHIKYTVENGVIKKVTEEFYLDGLAANGKSTFYDYDLYKTFEDRKNFATQNRARNLKRRREVARKAALQSTQTCSVCAGSGKEFIPFTVTVKDVKYSENDEYYFRKTTTRKETSYKILKCAHCNGTGKVK